MIFKLTKPLTFLATAVLITLALNCPLACADDIFVSTQGDDANPGTFEEPLRTVAEGALSLSPGDRLIILPGDYVEGPIGVRFVEPDTFLFVPLEGSEDKETIITGLPGHPPRIFGSFDIRGSHITIKGLQVIGDGESIDAGIAVFESHDIRVESCIIENHGGGGIQFSHCDMVTAWKNVCCFNASTNPDQQSGISSFQPVVRTDADGEHGVVFGHNVCFGNRNTVPSSSGFITDGNGIIIDDHLYTQLEENNIIFDILAGTSSREFSSGAPQIDLDENGALLPYNRGSLIVGNHCFDNGGRGIHAFLIEKALISANICFGNLRSQEIVDELPLDEDGEPFFRFGELSVVDSLNVKARRNLLLGVDDNSVAIAELAFLLADEPSTNRLARNFLIHLTDQDLDISVANVPDSTLLENAANRLDLSGLLKIKRKVVFGFLFLFSLFK